METPTLELSPDEFRKLGYAAVDLIADAMVERNAGNEPARRAVPEELADLDLLIECIEQAGRKVNY